MADTYSFLTYLPIEILLQIIAPLARKELKTLRLTNRKLYTIASEKLFESIAITTNEASYIQLLNIAASKDWSAQVRHIDWVLLHGYGAVPALAQALSIRKPWSTTLKKWKIKSTRGQFYDGLDLQCQLVKRIPNVQTVRFWSAVQSQRGGREPWENNFEDNAGDAVGSTKSIIDRFVIENASRDPAPDDVFSILRRSEAKPRLVKTVVATLHLGYSGSQKLESVSFLPRWSDYLPQNRREQKSIEVLPNWYAWMITGMKSQCKQEQYRGMTNENESKFFNHDMSCFPSLVRSGVRSLGTLKICSVWIFLEEMEFLLRANDGLRILIIGDIELSDDDNIEPMVNFLRLLRHLFMQRRLRHLKATFQKLRCRELSGEFSASEQQVQDWMEGNDDELLKIASSAFDDDSESDLEY